MSGDGIYRVAIWPEGATGDQHPWGYVFYQEADRWRPIEATPPCESEAQVIKEARDAAKLMVAKARTAEQDYRWQAGSPDQAGAFKHKGISLPAPKTIRDLEI